MKNKIFCMLLSFVMVFSLIGTPAYAEVYSGKAGAVSWTFDDETGLLTITGSGSVNGNYWSKHQDYITEVVIEEGITALGTEVLSKHYSLKTVHLPLSLTSIGISVFLHDENLNSIIYAGSEDDWYSNVQIEYNYEYHPIFDDISSFTFLGTTQEKTKIQYFYDINPITTDQFVKAELPSTVTAITEPGDKIEVPISYNSVDFNVAGEYLVTASVIIPDGYCMEDGTETAQIQFSVIVNAAPSGKCGENLNWIIKNDTLEITGSGDMYEYDNDISGKEIPWKNYAARIKYLSLPAAMTSISCDFIAGTSVSTVSLPASVSKICDGAFRNTTALTGIYGNNYFTREYNGFALYTKDMKTLVTYALKNRTQTSFYVPSGVENISAYAFENTGTETIYVPATVNFIGENAFGSNNALVGHKNSVAATYANANGNSFSETYVSYITKPQNITISAGSGLALPTTTTARLTTTETINVDLSYKTTYDTSYAHTETINAYVTVPENINNSTSFITFTLTVEEPSYSGTSGDISWLLKGGLLTLSGNGAMDSTIPWEEYLGQITSVSIGSGITSIPEGAFSGSNIQSISSQSPDFVVTDGILYNNNMIFYYLANNEGTEFTVADSITKIASKAFYDAKGLKTVTIRNTVTAIGANAFNNTLEKIITDRGSSANTYAVNNGIDVELIPAEIIEEGSYNGISYTVDANYHMTISGTGTLKKFSALIPDNKNLIKSITVEEGITGEDQYFTIFTAVETIEFPASCTTLYKFLYSDIPSLKYIYVSENNTNYYTIDGVLYQKSVNKMIYYPSAKEDSVFVVPDSTETIDSAFLGECPNLKEIKIGKSLRSFSGNTENCIALEKITVDAGNANYSSQDGVLYNKNKTILIKCPAALASENFTVPSTVNTIAQKAFANNNTLTGIEMSDNVTTLESSAFVDCTALTNVVLSDTITSIPFECFKNIKTLKTINMPKSLTKIHDDAFSYCESLESISFPQGLEYIYEWAFSYCYALKEVSIPSGTYVDNCAFIYCEGLSELTLNEGITHIGRSAFSFCENLEKVEIPSTLSIIDDSLFACCYALSDVILPSTVTEIGMSAFEECPIESISLPSSLKTIGSSAFYKTNLNSLTVPEGVTAIGSEAFSNCSYLTSVTLPESLTELGSSAFYKCTSLNQINIPNNLEIIDKSLLYGCSSLTSVVLPDGIKSIGNSAFYNCSALETINIPEGVTTIGTSSFRNCSSLKAIKLPDSVTTISDYAFRDCTSLETINIPDGVTTISPYSFRDCDALKAVEIPDSVTTISNYAFYDCGALEKVVIPPSVTTIAANAFRYCENLVIYGELNSYAHTYATENEIPFVYEQKIIMSIDDTWNNLAGVNLVIGDKYYLPDTVTAKTNIEGETLTLNITYDSTLDTSYAHTQSIKATLEIPENYQVNDGIITEKVISFTVSYPSYQGKVDNISWTLADGVLTISGTGDMPDFYRNDDDTTNIPWYDYSEHIYSIVVEKGITAIGDYAFYQLRLVTDISIPDSVTKIGNYAFAHATSDVEQVELILPSSLNTLGEGAFENMALYSITFPKEITYLPDNLFYKCPYLTVVTFDGIITNIGESAFYGAPVSEVYFAGTTEQWNNVTIAEKGNEDFIGGAAIYCNDPVQPEKIAVDYKIDYSTSTANIFVEVPKSAFSLISGKTAQIVAVGVGSDSYTEFVTQEISQPGSFNVVCSTKDISYIKIFVWESLDSIKPVALPYTIRVPSTPSSGGSSEN